MTVLFFVFFKILKELEINDDLRVSLWLEDDDSYLMPCKFTDVLEEDNFYSIRVNVLDPDKLISEGLFEHKFFFGHPEKVIGYGILKDVG